MGKRTGKSQLKDQINALGGSWLHSDDVDELETKLRDLQQRQQQAPSGRRRTRGAVERLGAVESPATKRKKKQKELQTLRAEDTSGIEEEIVKSLSGWAKDHNEGDLMPWGKVIDDIKSRRNVVGSEDLSPAVALRNTTLRLYLECKELDEDARKESVLRWLDASGQVTFGGYHRPEGQQKKKAEVEKLKSEVQKLVSEGRFGKILIAMQTAEGVDVGRELGLYGESCVVDGLRATTVFDMLQERLAPPFLSKERCAAFFEVLGSFDPSTRYLKVAEGPYEGGPMGRVDVLVKINRPIADALAERPEFASLKALRDFFMQLHVKTSQKYWGGPGFGEYKCVHIISRAEAHARAFKLYFSKIERGPGALERRGTHLYEPLGVPKDLLCDPNDGGLLNGTVQIVGGKLAFGAPFFRATSDEALGTRNKLNETTYRSDAAADGHSFGESVAVRSSAEYERQACFGHSLASTVTAALLNVDDFAHVSSWVAADEVRYPSIDYLLQCYDSSTAVEATQGGFLGALFSIASDCQCVRAPVYLERSKRGHAYDLHLLPSWGSRFVELRAQMCRIEQKAWDAIKTDVVHGVAETSTNARNCDVVAATYRGEGATAVTLERLPFCVENIGAAAAEVAKLLKALDASKDREAAFGRALAASPFLQRTRLFLCFVDDMDRLETQGRVVDFSEPWAMVLADMRDALAHILKRKRRWLQGGDAQDLSLHGPRARPEGYFDPVIPNGAAPDMTTPRPLTVRLARRTDPGGGVIYSTPTPSVRPGEPRPTPWKHGAMRVKDASAARCAADAAAAANAARDTESSRSVPRCVARICAAPSLSVTELRRAALSADIARGNVVVPALTREALPDAARGRLDALLAQVVQTSRGSVDAATPADARVDAAAAATRRSLTWLATFDGPMGQFAERALAEMDVL